MEFFFFFNENFGMCALYAEAPCSPEIMVYIKLHLYLALPYEMKVVILWAWTSKTEEKMSMALAHFAVDTRKT